MKILSASQFAARQNCSVSTIYRKVRKGELPERKLGPNLYFYPDDDEITPAEAASPAAAERKEVPFQDEINGAVVKLKGVLHAMEEIQFCSQQSVEEQEEAAITKFLEQLNGPACANVLDALWDLLQNLENAALTGDETLLRKTRFVLKGIFQRLKTVFQLEPFGIEERTVFLPIEKLESYRLRGSHQLKADNETAVFAIVNPGWRLGENIIMHPELAIIEEGAECNE